MDESSFNGVVIFDMDGIIVDSEQLWDDAREELVKEVGIDLLLCTDDIFETRNQARARLLDAALEFLEKSRLLGH